MDSLKYNKWYTASIREPGQLLDYGRRNAGLDTFPDTVEQKIKYRPYQLSPGPVIRKTESIIYCFVYLPVQYFSVLVTYIVRAAGQGNHEQVVYTAFAEAGTQ